MQTVQFRIEGISPLMMHNERLVNPRDPFTRELKALTAVRKKTPEINDQIAALEWRAGLYDADGRVVMPSANVLASIKEGAKKAKLGKQAAAGVFAESMAWALEYDGPKDLEELAADPRFFDFRAVGVMGKKVMRARPIFPTWAISGTLVVDEELLSGAEFQSAFEAAGRVIGLAEHRPQYGRFQVTLG